MTVGLFTYNPSSFIIHFTNGAVTINWNDIESIFAYKVDWFAFDDVHIDLIVKGEIISPSARGLLSELYVSEDSGYTKTISAFFLLGRFTLIFKIQKFLRWYFQSSSER